MKFRPVGVALFHADGRTDGHDEAKVGFRSFANEPKNFVGKPETKVKFGSPRRYGCVIKIDRIGTE
jgi:hypothetical protein